MSYYPIILRHDITSQWEASNYVLRKGEAGLDITLKKFKIGDGTTGWNSLDYFNIASLSVDQSLKLDSAYDHISSDGKDHSDVVLNNEHRASDGKDHSDVILNNTHRATTSGNPHNVLVTDLAQDSTHRFVTDTEKSTWNNKSDFSGSYGDLSDLPTIPSAIAEINDIPDVDNPTPTDGDLLRYNSTTLKYEPIIYTGSTVTINSAAGVVDLNPTELRIMELTLTEDTTLYMDSVTYPDYKIGEIQELIVSGLDTYLFSMNSEFTIDAGSIIANKIRLIITCEGITDWHVYIINYNA